MKLNMKLRPTQNVSRANHLRFDLSNLKARAQFLENPIKTLRERTIRNLTLADYQNVYHGYIYQDLSTDISFLWFSKSPSFPIVRGNGVIVQISENFFLYSGSPYVIL